MLKQFTTLRDVVRGFASAMNLISPEVENHHEKVAYLSYRLAEAMDMGEREKRLAFYSALLHDVGSVMLRENISLRELEVHPRALTNASAAFLKMFPATASLSQIVEESQSPWRRIKLLPERLAAPRRISQIVHLADTITLMLNENESVLNQVGRVRQAIACAGEAEFSPEVVVAFDKVCGLESVWMDLLYRPDHFLECVSVDYGLTLDDTVKLTELMSKIIDFRSPFTAMHSAGVSATAVCLAQRLGMSEEECGMMRIAGNLHDLGKLKIPKEILEKPGKLTDEEFNVMKEHAYYTYILLKDVGGFEQITAWASLHHEKLNGNGYPFHLNQGQLPLGARIMAVADIFSAIAEDRPYRKGMDKQRAIDVLREDAERGMISKTIVELLIDDYDAINAVRDRESRAASAKYQESLRKQD